MSSWAADDNRTLLHFSKSTLETFYQHVQASDSDCEAGGLLLGSVHGTHMLIEHATVPTAWDKRFRYLFERMPFGHEAIALARWTASQEPSAIWANGTPIRKTTPTRLASIDRNGTVCRPSVGISDQRSLSLLDEVPCILSWCQVRAKDQYFPLWNSDTTNQCRPSVPRSGLRATQSLASGSFNRCRQAHHRPQSHARKISTLVSRHLRRLRSFAPTSNHPPGFW